MPHNNFALFLLLALLSFTLPSCKVYPDVRPLEQMKEMAYPYPVSTVRVADMDIAYVQEGRGTDTLILIHGLGSYLPSWKKTIDGLRESYTCIALDLPGYGHSSKGNYPISMTFYAEMLKGFMKAMGIRKATIGGHSMGGQIAIFFSLAYPDLANRLILMAPAGFEQFTAGQREWFRSALTAEGVRLTTPEQIRVNMAYNFYDLPADAGFMIEDRIAMRSASDFRAYCAAIPLCVQAMVNDPVYDYLQDINLPVLVIFGDNDNLIPNRYLNPGPTREIAEDGTAQLPNAQLHMIPKAGHFVHFEKADTVNALIREFFER
jgi:pimeloyl-ACP methyl ester carboxylesterase